MEKGEGHWTLGEMGVWWFLRQRLFSSLQAYTWVTEGLLCARGMMVVCMNVCTLVMTGIVLWSVSFRRITFQVPMTSANQMQFFTECRNP